MARRGAWRAVQRGARCKMDDKHARQRIQLEKMGGRPAFFCEQRPQAALAQLWLEHTGGAWRSVWRGVARGARCSAVRGAMRGDERGGGRLTLKNRGVRSAPNFERREA